MMEDSQIVFELPDTADSSYVLNLFLTLKKKVVINLSSTATGGGILFTADNLETLLSAGIKKLYVETMEEKQYKLLMNQQLTLLLTTTVEIEDQLYYEYITDLSTPITDFLARLQNVIVMLTCFSLQKNNKHLTSSLEKLHDFHKDLGRITFSLEDNVCALDHFHYQIAPCLEEITKQLKG